MQATWPVLWDGRTSVGSGTAFVDAMQAVQHRAHQATGRPKPRLGRVETERALEPLESTTTATSASPTPEYGWVAIWSTPSTSQSTRGRLCTRPGGEADGTGTERGIR